MAGVRQQQGAADQQPSSAGLPVWSPDGQWIAFRSDRGGSWAIYAMRADGSAVRKIVDAPVLPVWFFEKMGWKPKELQRS